MKRIKARVRREREEMVELITILWGIAKKHPKKVILFLFFEAWIHTLAGHHIEEFENLMKKLLRIVGLVG